MYKALLHSIVLSSAVLSPSLLAAAPNSASSASGHFGRSTRIARVPARDWAQKPPAGHLPGVSAIALNPTAGFVTKFHPKLYTIESTTFLGAAMTNIAESEPAPVKNVVPAITICTAGYRHRFTQPGPQVPGRLRCQVALSSCPLVSVTVMIAHSCFCWGGRVDGRFGQRYSVLKFAPGGANNQALRSGGRGAWFSPYLSGASRHHRRLDLDAVMGVVTENSEGPRGARLSKRSHSEPL
jgi:hypothetical protein